MSIVAYILRKANSSLKSLTCSRSLSQKAIYRPMVRRWIVGGGEHCIADDFQYICLRLDWFRLWTVVIASYSAFAFCFGCLTYILLMSDMNHFAGNLHPSLGLFEQSFWLSVGHLITVGYGYLEPISFSANLLVAVQFFAGIFLSAVLMGIVVTKAGLPTVKLIFSDRCIITPRNGVRHFMFRVANTRGNLVICPEVRLCALTRVETAEGESIMTVQPLEVVTPPVVSPAFNLVHKIDQSSPLNEFTDAELQEKDYAISLVGTDNHTFQTLYAAKYYEGPNSVLTNVKFADVLKTDGAVRIIDLRKFQMVEPIKQKI